MTLAPRRSLQVVALSAAAIAPVLALLLTATDARAAQAPIGLGTAAGFSVLAGTTVTNTGPTTLAADLGVDPGSAVTGGPVVLGATHIHDTVSGKAQADNVVAYLDAAARTPATSVNGDLVGRTLVPGVYTSDSSLGLTGTVTLDAKGDPRAVFVFQIASTLITGSASQVALVNGGQACNVFWQVGSSATLGTGTRFRGTVLALTSITAQTAATVEGRLLARNGAVTLDSNTITTPGCALAGPAPSGSPVPSTSVTPTAVPPGSTGGPSTPDNSTGTPGTRLPVTGPRTPVTALAVLGGAAVGLGAMLVAYTRRRPETD
jgi:hypothetical protein